MKYAADPSNWIFGSDTSICQLNNGKYVNTSVQKCDVIFAGAFNKANVSIVSALLPLSLDEHVWIILIFADHWFPQLVLVECKSVVLVQGDVLVL